MRTAQGRGNKVDWNDIVSFLKRPSNEVAADAYNALPSASTVGNVLKSTPQELITQYNNKGKQTPQMDQGTQDMLFAEMNPIVKEYFAKKMPIEQPQQQPQPKAEMNPIVKEYFAKKMPIEQPQQQPQPKAEMNPIVKEYFAKKQNEDRQSGLGWAQFAAGIGDAMAGRSPSESAKTFDNIRSNIKDETIGQAMRDKAQSATDFKNKQMMDQSDPNSQQSQAFRKIIEAQFPNVAKSFGSNWSQVSAADKENIFEPLKLKENIDSRKEQMRILAQGRQDTLDLKKSEIAKKNSPEERVKGLSGIDKARYDNALMALKGLDEMGTALDNGQNTFSMIGDNDYTAASRRATEAYGRMQSGGAINKDEEARFEKTLPRITDSKDIQRKKLLTQKDEMISRLKTLGFTPEQVGYEPRSFNYGAPKQSSSKPKQIIQNGHTYILNEATGEYE